MNNLIITKSVATKINSDAILDHYLDFGIYTYPGLYKDILEKELPDEVREIGRLVRNQVIHRVCLQNGRNGRQIPECYGDMSKVPWFRQCEDDNLVTAGAMLAELYRRDSRGIVMDRKEEDRLVLTCRFVSIFMASILKSKRIPARVRSGFDPYATPMKGKACDHWINQYWNKEQKRWVTIDVDCSLENVNFDPYDMPDNTFIYSADAWLRVREGKTNGKYFWNACGLDGLMVISWELFYDFHSLMNSEIMYRHTAQYVYDRFDQLTVEELSQIDNLAKLMQNPDENFEELKRIWNTNKDFRLLKGSLL